MIPKVLYSHNFRGQAIAKGVFDTVGRLTNAVNENFYF
jgi:hypothetical protein